MALISPLENTVWFAIFVVLVFAIILRFTLFDKISFLEILAIILGVAWNRQPIGFYYRTMFMSWIIFGFLLTQFYLASLPGMLLADPEQKINTINDLLNSGIPLGGSKNQRIHFIGNKTYNSSSNSNELIDKVFEKFIEFERVDYEKKLHDLISGKNNTMALLVISNSSTLNTNFDRSILNILPEAMTTFPLGFPVWRGLPYLNDIDIVIQRLITSGIISHIFNLETKNNNSNKDEDVGIYITLEDLMPGISFEALVSPLSKSVWFATIFVLLFAIILRYTLFVKISLLEIMAIILGVAWNKQPVAFSYRIMFMSWVIFGFLLTQFYLASLPGDLLADPVNDIHTINDLLDSGIPIGGSKSQRDYFLDNKTFNAAGSPSRKLIHRIFKNLIVYERDEYNKKLYELISGKNSTMAFLALMNTSIQNSNFDFRVVHLLPEALTSFRLTFPVWDGLPYLNDINISLQRLINTGIIAHFFKTIIRNRSIENEEDYIYIILEDLIPGFLILGIGCTIGIISLFFEIIIFRIKQRDKKKCYTYVYAHRFCVHFK
ncbi:hypothetical protein HCN44_004720 [Aphidius gifuensis]|uniref:Ionotropic receptor n=1 Tax=Aphidius gifuensis TaxID=684658 RepID=A0A834XXD2_APHGI|nr:hypothetical protein HCN44_004720 [Aphidius gifuensis]